MSKAKDSEKPASTHGEVATTGTAPATEHTPGPWRLGEANHCIIISTADDTTLRPTAIVADCEYLRPSEEAKANARLIAAAPDLLAALQRADLDVTLLLPFLTGPYKSGLEAGRDAIRAAIAKATKGDTK